MEPHQKEAEQERELRKRRQAWEAGRKARKEEEARQEKQARLVAHIKRRAAAWQDHTGQLPPADVLADWQAEYIAQRAIEAERERAARQQAAESEATI